jgi:integrase/recombinase XerD
VRDLLARTNPRQPKVVHLESGAGLSNATVLLRLTVVRLFYDHLVLEGIRPTNPVGRMHWRRRYGRWPGDAPLVRRHRKLPWIPTEEQWQAILAAMQRESPRNRAMFCPVVRRGLAPARDRPRRHQRSRPRAPIGPRPCRKREERVRAHRPLRAANRAAPGCVPRSSSTADARARTALRVVFASKHGPSDQYLGMGQGDQRRRALVSGVGRFTTHTLRHLCLTDLARAGWDIHEIAAFAGHRSLASTLLYIHVSGRELSSKLATTMSHLHAWRIQQLAEVRS